jgi:hypothetical protein
MKPLILTYLELFDALTGQFVEHESRTYAALQSVTRLVTLIVTNLVTPQAATEHELFYNRLALEVGSKSDLCSTTK